ncbi:hypothetical protein EXN66_Car002735 [Channa argus]|uniref:Uncharacterized protein n=1 Tax=Channa argus TaxID=215402 RepID=A0A6G1PA37_CHAAH|nr:hypothetical protein EXN66_Car002735 [Channa argus]KAK2919580.1 hypothetical protein Q8A73_003951 [Channa argus]
MPSEGSAVQARLNYLYAWFDPESAAVVTILLGLFQLVLSVPLVHCLQTLPKLFILPIFLGLLIVAGGSLTMANERNPSRQLLQGCAYTNVLGLLGALLAFILYCYSLSTISTEVLCEHLPEDHRHQCPTEALAAFSWSITFLLLIYNTGAMILHGLLSVSALKALKAH